MLLFGRFEVSVREFVFLFLLLLCLFGFLLNNWAFQQDMKSTQRALGECLGNRNVNPFEGVNVTLDSSIPNALKIG